MEMIVKVSLFGAAIGYIIYFIYVKPRITKRQVDKLIEELDKHKIEEITNNGFTVYIESIPEYVSWISVKSLEFSENDSLKITLKSGKELLVLDDCQGRLTLLRNVPIGISKFDYEYNDHFFNSLEPCKICGLYAIKDDECLNCVYSVEFEKKFIENRTQEEFCKEEQLDYITSYFDVEESVEETFRKAISSDTFKPDKNWKFYPSKQEVFEEKQRVSEIL